jgi:nucleotide-binding universal stress UspA family protein
MLRQLWAGLTGQSDALIPFEDLKRTLGFINQGYRGLQAVPMDKIIGSLGRSGDFDRAFLPKIKGLREKWVSVDSAYLDGINLPPISLYKVDDAYFVVDGHHRVSVARQKGQTFIDAEVIEVQSRIPVTPDLTMDDLDTLAAYRRFLDETHLDRLRPDQNMRMSMPGDYGRLLDHIRMHKYFVETDESRELGWEDAVVHWYDHVYIPVIQAIRRYHLLNDFPRYTEADLYIWIIEHAYFLSKELGQEVDPSQVGRLFASRFGRRPRRLLERVTRSLRNMLIPDSLEAGPPAGTWREERLESRGAPHVFRNILVAVTGAESGWLALSQAAAIAQREESVLHGLHVMPTDDAIDPAAAEARGQQVLDEFTFRCDSLGIQSTQQLVKGDVAEQIIERARWVDLVVINQRREHGRWAERPLGTIFQTVTEQAARPILAVPGTDATSMKRILLAYDGSPKAREALFVFRHIAECWGASGVILTVEGGHTDHDMLDLAWQYVQGSGALDVTTRFESGPAHDAILRVMKEEEADMLLMGSYGYQPLIKAFLGSTVDRILRVAWFPVLICR